MRNPRLDALSEEAVRSTARRLSPGPIRKWSVGLNDREFPVKQIVREAANSLQMKSPRVTPVDFIPSDAVRILRRLGFEVRYSE